VLGGTLPGHRGEALDLKELKEILRVLDERGITEFELEKEGIKLRVRKSLPTPPAPTIVSPAPGNPAQVVVAPSVARPPAAPAPAAAETDESEGLTVVKSPIVGTFYRAPDPSAPPFVNVGDHVRVGQVLCIVEAMKLMNEIESELNGEVVKIHVENAQPVQYGDALFAVRPD
jgi:acetyl-CoA carboxylase biotin carboxyl carrier protein